MIVDVLLFMVMLAAMVFLILGIILIPLVTIPLLIVAVGLLVAYVLKHRREDVGE